MQFIDSVDMAPTQLKKRGEGLKGTTYLEGKGIIGEIL